MPRVTVLISIALLVATFAFARFEPLASPSSGDRHFFDHDRHWSGIHDAVDSFYALTDSVVLDPRRGKTLDVLLSDPALALAVIVCTPGNYRDNNANYEGTDELFNAWKALVDARRFGAAPETTRLIDANVKDHQVKQHVEEFLGYRVGAPTVHVLVRRSALSTAPPSEVTDPALLRQLREVEAGHIETRLRKLHGDVDWHSAGLHRIGIRTYMEIKHIALWTFGPLVRRFCDEWELRDMLRETQAANHAALIAWHVDASVLFAAAYAALSKPRGDLIVAAIDQSEKCDLANIDNKIVADASLDMSVDIDPADPAALRHIVRAARVSRAVLLRDYNFENRSLMLYVARAGLKHNNLAGLGLQPFGLDYYGNERPRAFDPIGGVEVDTASISRQHRVLMWVDSVRRESYPADVFKAVGAGQNKFAFTPAHASCGVGASPNFGDRVLVESSATDATTLVEFHRWTQRWVTVGTGAHELPIHFDLLLLKACPGLSMTTALATVDTPNAPLVFHTFSIAAIERGAPEFVASFAPLTDERKRTLGMYASEQLRLAAKGLAAIDEQQHARFLDAFFAA